MVTKSIQRLIKCLFILLSTFIYFYVMIKYAQIFVENLSKILSKL